MELLNHALKSMWAKMYSMPIDPSMPTGIPQMQKKRTEEDGSAMALDEAILTHSIPGSR